MVSLRQFDVVGLHDLEDVCVGKYEIAEAQARDSESHAEAIWQRGCRIIGVTVMIEIWIGDEEGALLACKLFNRLRQAAAAEVDGRRQLVPKHILSPFGDGFDVEQLLGANIDGDGIASP
jgi:hypothetical protein